MADEFMKGLALFSLGGLGLIVFGGWYRTPSFENIVQLVNEPQEIETVYDQIGLFAGDVMFWLMIVGPLTFWVLIPAVRQLRSSGGEAAN